jgi:hypothetical protein
MQYIQTKYLSPTNTKGSRIKAWTSYGNQSLTISWDYSLNGEANHAKAAMKLAEELNWFGQYVCGGSNDGCVFVMKDRSDTYTACEVFEVAV